MKRMKPMSEVKGTWNHTPDAEAEPADNDFGEPYYISGRSIFNRNGVMATADIFGDKAVQENTVACVNAMAGRDPSALADLEAAVSEATIEWENHGQDHVGIGRKEFWEMVSALAAFRGEK